MNRPLVVLLLEVVSGCQTELPPQIDAELAPTPPAAEASAGPATRGLSPLPCAAADVPAAPTRFGGLQTSQAMMWVYRDHYQDIYCGCDFDGSGVVGTSACGYQNPDDPRPGIDWEEIVPSYRFGVYRPCWLNTDPANGEPIDPRESCATQDPEFRAMEADLYNLQPALAELTRVRAANPYGMVRGEPRLWGSCDFETERVMGKYLMVEPPPDVRGDIARTVFYMAWRYGGDKTIKLSAEQRALFTEWDKSDPVDEWERLRACRIQAIQGWANPFVR